MPSFSIKNLLVFRGLKLSVGYAERIAFRHLLEFDHNMDVAEYERSGLVVESEFNDEVCHICRGKLKHYREPKEMSRGDIMEFDEIIKSKPESSFILMCKNLFSCPRCGWWRSNERGVIYPSGIKSRSPDDYCPGIEKIDISSSKVAIDDLVFHLTRKWSDRKLISASAAELLVGSLLKEHLGCDVVSATANTNTQDGGIDLHVCHKGGKILSAVQVKRRINRDVEGVAEVRNFLGALAIENISKGIFVTTATRYSKKALEIPDKLKHSVNARLELELFDGERLFELLKSLPRANALILPKEVSDLDIWLDDSNNEFTTRQILYGY